MMDPIQFHTDLYRREALEQVAEKFQRRLRVELAESGTHIEARLEPLQGDADVQALRDEFCNEAFSATARRLRDGGGSTAVAAASDEPPWALLAPFGEGDVLGLGWVLESLSPVRHGAATLVLRHAEHGKARVALRRNGGAPLGVAYTDHIDFMLMNGGGGTAQTEASVGSVLGGLAAALRARSQAADDEILAALLPHAETRPTATTPKPAQAPTRRLAPHIDPGQQTISFDFDETGISRLALYDAVLRFADRCYIFLTRPDSGRLGVHIRPRGACPPEQLKVLVRDVTTAINQVARNPPPGSPADLARRGGLAPLARKNIDLDALLAELAAADPQTVGIGFEPERGPGHQNLRVLNIRGTGACNSECVFCIEKFNPTHRPMPSADATRQMILDSAGNFDMLFFASGEPTIHPKLFEYVDLAKSVGFTSFGMSSHFRTFADPAFTLKVLQAGFEYFDIALHAADRESQLDVNPIEDDGESLYEALKGLAVLLRLADVLGIRVSITQKVVISKLNVTQLEAIFRSTYDRGVRHFIFQPVRPLGLAPALQEKLAIDEDVMLTHLNELLRKTENTGAVIKPYGFSRMNLFEGSHVEAESNRVKNLYGKLKERDMARAMPTDQEERPTDGRFWVEVVQPPDYRFAFSSDGSAPILDRGLDRGLDLPFGCRMGSCGMCCAKLVKGQVDQSTQIFLSEEQMQQGYVLMCQARPLSDVVVEVCTDDEIDRL